MSNLGKKGISSLAFGLLKHFSLIQLFPNPTNNKLQVVLERSLTNAKLSIVDITGKLVFQNNDLNGDNFTLDLKKFIVGVYFIEMTMNNQRIIQKFVVNQ